MNMETKNLCTKTTNGGSYSIDWTPDGYMVTTTAKTVGGEQRVKSLVKFDELEKGVEPDKLKLRPADYKRILEDATWRPVAVISREFVACEKVRV